MTNGLAALCGLGLLALACGGAAPTRATEDGAPADPSTSQLAPADPPWTEPGPEASGPDAETSVGTTGGSPEVDDGTSSPPPSDVPTASSDSAGGAATGDDALALRNGTFEADLSGWTLGGVKKPIRSTAYSHTGAAALRCGATSGSGQPEPDGSSIASQRFTVPAGLERPRLSFWTYTTTRDLDGDYQEALLLDAAGNVLETVFHHLSDARAWRAYTVDLTPYRGETVELYLHVFSDGQTDPTSLWVDDVELADAPAETVAGTEGDAGVAPSGEAHGPRDDGAAVSVHTTLGLPDGATASLDDPDRHLSVKPQYVQSYNSSLLVSNWVAWALDSSWIGTTDRTDDFRQDDTLPAALPQASNSDYSYSGYDRGHLCNAQDRSATVEDMSSTFYLSNMIPQAPNNNRGPWLRLETYARELAAAGKHLFIYAGPIFNATPVTIGASRVAVPLATWKVVVVLEEPTRSAASVTSSARVISVIVPNDDALVSASDGWALYRTSVNDVQLETGLDLLSDVDTSVQQVLEARIDPGP